MRKLSSFFLFLSFVIGSLQAQALYTELGVNYAYKKSSMDAINNTEQQSTTGSVSLYFWDRVAIELSYTNSLYVKKEQNSAAATTSVRTTSQISDIYGCDLIYVFADKKASFQPYIKGGAAYIVKTQKTQIDNQPPWNIATPAGTPYIAPSYGIGLKFFLTDAIALRTGFDVMRTPIDPTNYVEDTNGRLGLSWIF